MDKMLLNFGGRLGRCWTELISPLPKTIATLVLTILVILLICVGLGFLAYGLAEGNHIPEENKEAGLAISGSCLFAITVIFLIIWAYKCHSKRRNSAAAIPLREQSRTTANDTFLEVVSDAGSAEVKTPLSTEPSTSVEVASISCGKDSSEGTCDQLAEVEVHNENLQVVSSDSDEPVKEQPVPCPQENTVKEEPVSADEQNAPVQEQQEVCYQGNAMKEEPVSADEQIASKSVTPEQEQSQDITLVI